MALGTAASGPGDHFLRLINSGDQNKCKFNQKTRSILVFTFRATQNPDRLDTFDFDKITLKIITSARKHQTFQIFTKFSDQSVEKQKSYAILNDRLETFDRYCLFDRNKIIVGLINLKRIGKNGAV
jgi:hypothetical protein